MACSSDSSCYNSTTLHESGLGCCNDKQKHCAPYSNIIFVFSVDIILANYYLILKLVKCVQ
jgi:hypothetical protein